MSKNENPRVSIWPGEGSDEDPPDVFFVNISVNGNSMPSIRTTKEIAYNLDLHRQVEQLVRAVYHIGRFDGEAVGKQKIADLLKWAKT